MRQSLIPALVLALAGPLGDPIAKAQSDRPADGNPVDVVYAIGDLASADFSVRQTALQTLVAAGTIAVDALEKAAVSAELETAARCVEVMARIARDKEAGKPALAALERLATDDSNRVSERAARAVMGLKATDEDLAIAALAAEGARLGRSRDGDVFSATVSRDRQVGFLKHLPHLRIVRMRGGEVTDAGMDRLADLKRLSSLTISRTSVTDFGLRKLKTLRSLDRLTLAGEWFTSDGLRQLRHLGTLRTLSLHDSFSEADLSFLSALPQLDLLFLSVVGMGKHGVATLNQLDDLRRLHLSLRDVGDEQMRWLGQIEVPLHLSLMRSTEVTDAGFQQLEDTRLLGLSLLQTPVTDAGMAHIGKMQFLESLIIIDAPVSDRGLMHLKDLNTLRSLMLRDTQVTEEGVEGLHRLLPNLRRR